MYNMHTRARTHIYLQNQLEEEDEDGFSKENTKHSSRFLAIPRPNISTGVNRLVKGIKSLSQLFSKSYCKKLQSFS